MPHLLQQHDWHAAGFMPIVGVLSQARCETIASLAEIDAARPGARDLLKYDWCSTLADELRANSRLFRLLPASFVAVQCNLFSKSAEQNWLVGLHQDLSIAVAERVAGEGLGGWSLKDGVHYVQPPVALLQQLVALRVHVDHCGENDGALSVVPGSHRFGRLSVRESQRLRENGTVHRCDARQGDLLVLRPLLLHSSSKCQGVSRRRVLHYVFGPRELPGGLRWHQAV